MAYSESYSCDICGTKKGEGGSWFLSWNDCMSNTETGTQPVVKVTRWNQDHAHSPEVKHLCGGRCVNTLMDRFMSEQHEDPNAPCY